jgi:DNA anti-recombination protein RmuC
MFNLGRHDAKFVDPEFFVDPLDERFTGIEQDLIITPLLVGATLLAGATAYSGYASSQAAERQAEAARQQAQAQREAALAQVRQMQSDAEQRSREFQSSIEQSRARTAQAAEAARMAQESAMRQIAQQKTSSALAIQQQQLQSAMQRQVSAAPVGSKVRRRIGTPQALRTSLEIQSPLAGSASGLGIASDTTTGTGGLNV